MEDIGSREFDEFLHFNGIIDLDFVGQRFTWDNNRRGGPGVWEGIDCILQ